MLSSARHLQRIFHSHKYQLATGLGRYSRVACPSSAVQVQCSRKPSYTSVSNVCCTLQRLYSERTQCRNYRCDPLVKDLWELTMSCSYLIAPRSKVLLSALTWGQQTPVWLSWKEKLQKSSRMQRVLVQLLPQWPSPKMTRDWLVFWPRDR